MVHMLSIVETCDTCGVRNESPPMIGASPLFVAALFDKANKQGFTKCSDCLGRPMAESERDGQIRAESWARTP